MRRFPQRRLSLPFADAGFTPASALDEVPAGARTQATTTPEGTWPRASGSPLDAAPDGGAKLPPFELNSTKSCSSEVNSGAASERGAPAPRASGPERFDFRQGLALAASLLAVA